jgi:hypothetical protein
MHVATLLDPWKLDSQHAYFKFTMLNNFKDAMQPSFDINSLTCLIAPTFAFIQNIGNWWKWW